MQDSNSIESVLEKAEEFIGEQARVPLEESRGSDSEFFGAQEGQIIRIQEVIEEIDDAHLVLIGRNSDSANATKLTSLKVRLEGSLISKIQMVIKEMDSALQLNLDEDEAKKLTSMKGRLVRHLVLINANECISDHGSLTSEQNSIFSDVSGHQGEAVSKIEKVIGEIDSALQLDSVVKLFYTRGQCIVFVPQPKKRRYFWCNELQYLSIA